MTEYVARPVPTLDRERELASKGYSMIVGFDEVGRGSLAGPAMVGAAALMVRDQDLWEVPDGVADSKMLTEARRESLLEPLKSWTAAWAVGAVSAPEIDDWGITYALGVAAVRALNEVETLMTSACRSELGVPAESPYPDGESAIAPNWHATICGVGGESQKTPGALPVLVPVSELRVAGILDGPNDYITPVVNSFDAPELLRPIRMTTMIKGDQHCATVAAAAVISKVTRDHLMDDLAAAHPEWQSYGWSSNKGYGTNAHRKAIASDGPTPYHRLTWHLA